MTAVQALPGVHRWRRRGCVRVGDRQHVLVLEAGSTAAALADRVEGLGLAAVRAPDLDAAVQLLEARVPLFEAVIVPAQWPADRIRGDLGRLRRAGPEGGLPFVAWGKPPDRATRKALRAAGVALALWEPFDDGTLRFQLNRAFDGGRVGENRRAERVPTYLLARILPRGGSRALDAVVYSLSTTGAFVETPRARMGGAQLELEIRVPGEKLVLHSEVVFTNLPGNLQRANLPLGMGVRFLDPSPETERRLRDYLRERAAALLV